MTALQLLATLEDTNLSKLTVKGYATGMDYRRVIVNDGTTRKVVYTRPDGYTFDGTILSRKA